MQQETIQGFRLSTQQKRLWLMQHDNTAYRAQCAIFIEGRLNVPVLKEVAQSVVARHEILRTTFARPVGIRIPVQVIADESSIYWRDISLNGLDEHQQKERIDELFESEGLIPFDLESGPVVRFSLLNLAANRNVLFVTLPSLCADGATLHNLYSELASLYRACLNGEEAEPADEAVQYIQFSEWQRELLESDEEEGRDYWRRQDYEAANMLTLPLETPHDTLTHFAPAIFVTGLNREVAEQVESLLAAHNVSLAVFLQTCWQTLLWHLTKQPEVYVNVLCACRIYEEMEQALGLYAKWLPVPARFAADLSFTEILRQVDESLAAAREWQEYFSWEHEARGVTEAFEAFVPVSFDFVRWPEAIESREVKFSLLEQRSCAERFKLKLSCIEQPDALKLEFHYDQADYAVETIKLIAGRLMTLIRSAIEKPEAAIGELDVLDENERRQLLSDWNDTKAEFTTDLCLHQLFEAQVERTPYAVAVVSGEVELSYRELNGRANRLAHHLRRLGVGPESRVALCMERSAEMMVALLGTLKAGAAYVPLDTAQPKSRLAFTLQDAEVSVALTHERLLSVLPEHQAQVICMDADWETIAQEDRTNPLVNVTTRNLAYVIYTSGSTGNPKGVMIEHASVVNLAHALAQSVYQQQAAEILRVSLNAPLSFDSSVKQWVQLLRGHTLCVLPEEVRRDGRELLSYLSQQKIDALDCTPSQLWLLLEAGLMEKEHGSASLVLLGGEAVELSTWELLSNDSSARIFYNVYGPTECTVDATACRLRAELALPTIGRPLANMQVYLLDQSLKPAPTGAPAEIYIGGAGLARGYLARPELTAERFVPHPFSAEAGARLYKTGDLARYLSDGQIEFLGRCDNQVKIRGSRIELGEIEAALEQHATVRRAVVVVRDDSPGDKRLVAYIVAGQERTLSVSELRSFLQERVPDYMIPAAFVRLEALPLTRNGKVDRKALPAPEQVRPETERAFVAARTPVEEMLCGIFSNVLGLAQVGIHDSFFELGGHSLLATQAVSQIRKAFQIELPLRTLFEAPQISALAEQIEAARQSSAGVEVRAIERVSREGRLPLSFAQQRLWFLDQLEPGSAAYLVPAAVRLKGALDVAALKQSLSEIVRRHETLRTSFAVVDSQPVQIIAPADNLSLPLIDLREFSEAEREAQMWLAIKEETQQPFDLSCSPLMRASLLRLGEEEHVLLLTLHHIILDAWSIEVLLREVATHYEAFAAGETPTPRELPVQYADYAHWQREWLQGEVLEKQLAYWRQQLDGCSMLELPTDRPRPPFQTSKGAHRSFILPDALTRSLIDLSRREGVTLFMTLLAAFQTLLYRYSGQEDLSIGTPIANRSTSDLEDLIGFFLNTLVLRTDLSGNPRFSQLLKRVREVALSAYAHQDVPFEKLVEELQPQRNTSRTPFFQVMFALRNVSQKDLKLPGLTMSLLEIESGTAKFDLLLMVDETEQGLRAEFEYNTDLFDETTINRIGAHFLNLLEGVVRDPEQEVSRLPMLTTDERRQLLLEWNDTGRTTARAQGIHRMFEAQAERTPDAVALRYQDQHLSYRELNERANQLAHHLRRRGVGPEALVGILMQRSVEMLVALLGVLKAGGAYVPLDPAYPQERLSFMLEDAGIRVLLTEEELADRAVAGRSEALCLDKAWEKISQESTLSPDIRLTPENLAYVIYTSGSTGRPKGVAIEHRSAVTLLNWAQEIFTPAELAGVLASTSICFDLSIFELFVPLTSGGAVILVENALELATLDAALAVTLVNTVPSAMAELLRMKGVPTSVRTVNLAGEALKQSIVEQAYEQGVAAVYNLYGPTEDTTYSTYTLVEQGAGRQPTIGVPMDNTQVYILDQNNQPVPVGVTGELYLSGAGLARGYLGRPELTAEKFTPNPFSTEPGARMYHTGDLARYLPDGRIEYLGRIDHQLKVRGFRIELGEIEVVLAKHPAIREAVVVAREEASGEKRLVAYVVADEESSVAASEWRSYLRERLPQYMLPSAFVTLAEMPLTPNGKVDRRALPEPHKSREELESNYVAPRTPVEEMLAEIWSNMLGIEQVGIYDSFFELGGHSLLATQAVSQIRQAFQIELPLRTLFEAPTVAGIAERMVREAGQPEGLEELALLWKELRGLSEEEAGSMLSQEYSEAAGASPSS